MSGIRLFAGLSIPSALRRRIALLQGGIPGARWTPPDNYHITLSFIGNVDVETADRADEALSTVRAQPFLVEVSGAGSFAQGEDPEVLWLGVNKNVSLMHLQEKVHRALESARVPVESRKYTPHVTLARFRDADTPKLASFLQEHADFRAPPFEVVNFLLYQSHLTKNGPVYEEVRQYPLSSR